MTSIGKEKRITQAFHLLIKEINQIHYSYNTEGVQVALNRLQGLKENVDIMIDFMQQHKDQLKQGSNEE